MQRLPHKDIIAAAFQIKLSGLRFSLKNMLYQDSLATCLL
jgi:hypothetical protein